MESFTIPVGTATHGLIRELADRTGEPMTVIVDRAVRDYRRRRFWEEYHAAIEADPSAWADFQGEIDLWDSTSADGMAGFPGGGEMGPSA